MKILIVGGTGFLGNELGLELLRRGHTVLVSTRKNLLELDPSPFTYLNWPVRDRRDVDHILSCEAVINLAGESIADGRWSDERKQALRDSRIQVTQDLIDILKQSVLLKTFLSSSAIGIYGDRKTEVLTEDSPAGQGFLAELCKNWEKVALSLNNSNPKVRVCLLRTGVVLSRGHGFLTQLEPIFKNWGGGPIGDGQQMLSWIHVKDWVQAVLFALENGNVSGALNLTAPEPVSNKSFSAIYSELFHQPFLISAPAAGVKLAMGEMASIALDSQNCRPEKLMKIGFRFQFPYLKEALWNIYDFENQGRKVHEFFTASQWVPKPLNEVFQFFSDENNLEKLTPELLHFKVLKKSTEKISKGTLIDYSLKLHGVPASWRTSIDKWNPPHEFVDTQLKGPYSRWHHTHKFESIGGGTLMRDEVHYRLPMSGLGRLFGGWLVKKDVQGIFSFRKKVINEMYGGSTSP